MFYPRIIFGLAVLATLASSRVDHDGFEFYGGKKKKRRHGLNRATSDYHKDGKGKVRYDKKGPEIQTELVVTNDEAPPAPLVSSSVQFPSDGRLRNIHERLLLPRYSVLDFESKKESFWGRIYADGFPNPLQYFRANFGRENFRNGTMFVLAEPLTMCESGAPVLHNADAIIDLYKQGEPNKQLAVVALRGECTFGEKTLTLEKALSTHDLYSANVIIVFVNDEEGSTLFHPSAPEASDTSISATMISQDDGLHLIRALESNGSVDGRFVPMVCGDTKGSDYCGPLYTMDVTFVDSLNYNGKLYADGLEADFVQGEFGAWLDRQGKWNVMVPSDVNCCEDLTGTGTIPNTTAVVCLRGKCDFATKAENVEATGAEMLIVSSGNHSVSRMGCDPPSRGRKVNVSTIMVSSDPFEKLVSRSLDASLSSSIWMDKNKEEEVCNDEMIVCDL